MKTDAQHHNPPPAAALAAHPHTLPLYVAYDISDCRLPHLGDERIDCIAARTGSLPAPAREWVIE